MIIAGPCSLESKEDIKLAIQLKEAGATHFRGGVFKPRSSPYRWDGLKEEAIPLLKSIKESTGLPIVVEAMTREQIYLLYPYVDIFQIGSRNATASELLKEFGRQDKPVLLKRGMCSTIDEFIMCADFIISEGNKNVILCERGIRTFETYTRNTFDLGCIVAVKQTTNLPIVADASHATGRAEMVIPILKGALASGADGVMIEVSPDPKNAKTDGAQSLTIEQFKEFMRCV